MLHFVVLSTFLSPASGLRIGMDPPEQGGQEIPFRFVTSRGPVLSARQKRNVKDTWAMHSGAETEILDNKGCYAEILRAHSEELANIFERERFGPYKSDICRLAQLKEKGGFYLDTDCFPTRSLREAIPKGTSFTTVFKARGFSNGTYSSLLNAFIGVAPQHPLIEYALNLTLLGYSQKLGHDSVGRPGDARSINFELAKHGWFMGPRYLFMAYEWWGGEPVTGQGVFHHPHRSKFQQSYLLREDLDTPGIPLVDLDGKPVIWSRTK